MKINQEPEWFYRDRTGIQEQESRRREHRRFIQSLKVSALLIAALFAIPFALYGNRSRVTDEILPSVQDTQADTVPGTQTNTVPGTQTPFETDTGTSSEEIVSDDTQSAPDEPQAGTDKAQTGTDQAQTVQTAITGERDEDRILRVLNHKTGTVSEMDMGTYLTGVLCGEMPASFEPEALKAQAVAARTYTRYMLRNGGKHGNTADICTDSQCCQAYAVGGTTQENAKLREAVSATDGEIMLYNSAPILAVFHSSSAGLTRTAEAVWSGGQPYLQPVNSPEDASSIPNYYSRVEFTAEEFQKKIHAALPEADLSGSMSGWLTDAERDSAGSILTVRVGGIVTQGSRVRTMLGLRSACFTWETGNDKFIFYVTGFGHGVGMSQYGANQMARDGADYQQILTHYYTGITIGGYTP